jgi:hypothetical protein
MRLIKVMGLAAIAAVAAMAFIGTGAASAEDEVVLCKKLVEVGKLCPAGELWPKGTLVLALAQNPELVGNLPIKCEDSLAEVKTLADSGLPLPLSITGLSFGLLPKPELGKGCKGCPFEAFGVKTEVHTAVPYVASLTVKATDAFSLVATGKATVLCVGLGVSCTFEGENLTSPITHNGKHVLHAGTNLALINTNVTLNVTSEQPETCGTSSKWIASYTVYLAHSGLNTGLAWPALDVLKP